MEQIHECLHSGLVCHPFCQKLSIHLRPKRAILLLLQYDVINRHSCMVSRLNVGVDLMFILNANKGVKEF